MRSSHSSKAPTEAHRRRLSTLWLQIVSVILASILSLPTALAVERNLGLPEVAQTTDALYTARRARLGERLFHDRRLSADGTISCASCHVPERAFADGLPVAKGIYGQNGTRNTPTLWNVAFATAEFWDGRRQSLEEQASDPLMNPREHGLAGDQVLEVIRNDPLYLNDFRSAFHIDAQAISLNLIAIALASYERTLVAGNSPFDRYSYGHEDQALSASAIRGLQLFLGRAQCATCHLVGDTYALFTDNLYHSLGVGLKDLQPRLASTTTRLVNAPPEKLDTLIGADPAIASLGRFVVTRQPRDIGKFKTPSLRNVALTAPYMHDGSVATLQDALDVEVYYRTLETGTPLILTPNEKADLLELLRSLTSPVAAAR